MNAANKVLTAMKEYFVNLKDQPSNNSAEIDGKKIDNFITSDLRPLFGVFHKVGMAITMINEIAPVYPYSHIQSIEKTLYEITYTIPEFKVTFSDNFKDLIQKKV